MAIVVCARCARSYVNPLQLNFGVSPATGIVRKRLETSIVQP